MTLPAWRVRLSELTFATVRPVLARYGTSVLVTMFALGLRLELAQYISSARFPLFLAAVTLSAWAGGFGPGLVSTGLSTAVIFYFFPYDWATPIGPTLSIVLFIAAAVLISLLSGSLRKTQHLLESRVADRTSELLKTNEVLRAEIEERARAEAALRLEIAERQQVEAALERLALHDPLTSLPNRALLHEHLHQAILGTRRRRQPLALLLMDLDRFKEVNDTCGHQAGDLLLQQVAQRLQANMRQSDTIARLGGDEFGILLVGVDAEHAPMNASSVLEALSTPFVIEDRRVAIGASIGIALFPEHGTDAEALLRRADVAMYKAKRSGGGYQTYSPDQDPHSLDRLALTGELRQAIAQDELVLHYQPQADFQDGVVGVEALVRWQHPRHGMLPPNAFIPLAEQSGMMASLSQWVLNAALRQCRAWHKAGLDLRVAVNLSAHNLHEPDLVGIVSASLEKWGVPANRLELEITETTLMTDMMRAMAVLGPLRNLGVRIAIDDFGTGYSSLAYLKRLPVDVLKIDRSFVSSMGQNDNDLVIVRTIIDLGHNLGLKAIAEGVEDQTTWDLLSSLGCDAAQGYFLSRPLPAPEILRWQQLSAAA